MTRTGACDYEARAIEMAGNHRKFESFGWHYRPEDDENWTIVYTHHRDSGLVDISNAFVTETILDPFLEGDLEEEERDIFRESHNHWACGWVDGYSIRVYRDGKITDAFKAWCDLQERLADYPLLDEEDYSQREYDAAIQSIQRDGRRYTIDSVPADWPSHVFTWLWDNNQSELENRDDQGAYPSDKSLKDALDTLGWLHEDYYEEEDDDQ